MPFISSYVLISLESATSVAVRFAHNRHTRLTPLQTMVHAVVITYQVPGQEFVFIGQDGCT
jgi:hypothetical protein